MLPAHNTALDIHKSDTVVMVTHAHRSYSFPTFEVMLLPLRNTTTELLAHHLAEQIFESLSDLRPAIVSLKVGLEESEGRLATVRLVRSPARPGSP